MSDPLRSNWSLDNLLAQLPGLRRVDDGGDLLAFRVAGLSPSRTAYVYLYGDDPALIHYDLEDPSIDDGEWDHAVERGSVASGERLRALLDDWLGILG